MEFLRSFRKTLYRGETIGDVAKCRLFFSGYEETRLENILLCKRLSNQELSISFFVSKMLPSDVCVTDQN